MRTGSAKVSLSVTATGCRVIRVSQNRNRTATFEKEHTDVDATSYVACMLSIFYAYASNTSLCSRLVEHLDLHYESHSVSLAPGALCQLLANIRKLLRDDGRAACEDANPPLPSLRLHVFIELGQDALKVRPTEVR